MNNSDVLPIGNGSADSYPKGRLTCVIWFRSWFIPTIGVAPALSGDLPKHVLPRPDRTGPHLFPAGPGARLRPAPLVAPIQRPQRLR